MGFKSKDGVLPLHGSAAGTPETVPEDLFFDVFFETVLFRHGLFEATSLPKEIKLIRSTLLDFRKRLKVHLLIKPCPSVWYSCFSDA